MRKRRQEAPMLKAGVVYLDHLGDRWKCTRVSWCSATVRPLSERAAKHEAFEAKGQQVVFTRPGAPIEINPQPIGWREEK